MMRAIVTGGEGFIGSALVNALLESGSKVLVIDNYFDNWSRKRRELTSCIYPVKVLDVAYMSLDYEEACDLLEGPPDIFYHFAAHYANARSIAEPIANVRTNCQGTIACLEWCNNNDIRDFVYASSSISASEAGRPEVLTPYGITKYAAELLCECYCKYFGFNVAAPRFFNVYGPGDMPGKYRAVIPNFFKQALEGTEIIITGEEQARDFTHISDVIAGILAGAENITEYTDGGFHGHFVCYNIAKGYSDRLTEVAKIITQLTNSRSEIIIKEDRLWEGIQDRVGDTKVFRALFPHVADNMTTIINGLASSYEEWYKYIC